MLPWSKPKLFGKEKKYVVDALNSSWISGGKYISQLENKLKKYFNVKFAFLVSSGTAAIHLSYLSIGLKPKDEIIVPGFGYMAAANIAKLMGSDIEFFLYDKAAIIEGKGSIAKLFEIHEPIIILLVNPGVSLSTKKVFETNNLFSANFRVGETLNNNLNKMFKITHNDLEDAAIKLCPDIGKIKDEISKQKGLIASRMTGSGSSYFAVFEDRNATLLAEQQIKNYNSNWWTSIVTTI